jgi:hypothetical protein
MTDTTHEKPRPTEAIERVDHLVAALCSVSEADLWASYDYTWGNAQRSYTIRLYKKLEDLFVELGGTVSPT